MRRRLDLVKQRVPSEQGDERQTEPGDRKEGDTPAEVDPGCRTQRNADDGRRRGSADDDREGTAALVPATAGARNRRRCRHDNAGGETGNRATTNVPSVATTKEQIASGPSRASNAAAPVFATAALVEVRLICGR
jgi:hypothetical protein